MAKAKQILRCHLGEGVLGSITVAHEVHGLHLCRHQWKLLSVVTLVQRWYEGAWDRRMHLGNALKLGVRHHSACHHDAGASGLDSLDVVHLLAEKYLSRIEMRRVVTTWSEGRTLSHLEVSLARAIVELEEDDGVVLLEAPGLHPACEGPF